MVNATFFDSADGVRVHELSSRPYNPAVTKSSDGKIWFVPSDGVSVIDPHHLPFNTLPPPVHTEQVLVDWKPYETGSNSNQFLSLPPLARLQIESKPTKPVAS